MILGYGIKYKHLKILYPTEAIPDRYLTDVLGPSENVIAWVKEYIARTQFVAYPTKKTAESREQENHNTGRCKMLEEQITNSYNGKFSLSLYEHIATVQIDGDIIITWSIKVE